MRRTPTSPSTTKSLTPSRSKAPTQSKSTPCSREQIDQRDPDNPYYIAPNGRAGQEAFAVIREAMRDKSMVALGRVVLLRRERVMMIHEAQREGVVMK